VQGFYSRSNTRQDITPKGALFFSLLKYLLTYFTYTILKKKYFAQPQRFQNYQYFFTARLALNFSIAEFILDLGSPSKFNDWGKIISSEINTSSLSDPIHHRKQIPPVEKKILLFVYPPIIRDLVGGPVPNPPLPHPKFNGRETGGVYSGIFCPTIPFFLFSKTFCDLYELLFFHLLELCRSRISNVVCLLPVFFVFLLLFDLLISLLKLFSRTYVQFYESNRKECSMIFYGKYSGTLDGFWTFVMCSN